MTTLTTTITVFFILLLFSGKHNNSPSARMREMIIVVRLSFIHSLCQQRISKVADYYALIEEELQLDDGLSFFNLPHFRISA